MMTNEMVEQYGAVVVDVEMVVRAGGTQSCDDDA